MSNIVFLSGIPRSGSQVLCSVLNQHPSIYASTTSPLADLLIEVDRTWPVISQAIVDRHPDQYSNMIRGLINGTYQHVQKSIIVDKNRLWPRIASEQLSNALGHKSKIIYTVRNIPEVLSSYILLIRKNKNQITFIDQELIDLKLPLTDKNRCKILWEKFINHPYTSVRAGLNSVHNEKLIIDYHQIVNETQNTVDKICKFIGVDSFTVNTSDLQSMEENDNFHGGMNGLHDVRPIMAKTSPKPEEVIGHELTKLYTDMNLDFWKKYINHQNTL